MSPEMPFKWKFYSSYATKIYMHLTLHRMCYMLQRTISFLFNNQNKIWDVQIMKSLIFQTPAVLGYIVPLKAKYKDILWHYFAILVYWIYFRIFSDNLLFSSIYVIYCRKSRSVKENNIFKHLPNALVMEFLLRIVCTNPLSKVKPD